MSPKYILGVLLLVLSSTAGVLAQTPPSPTAHDTDLDEILVIGQHRTGVPLLTQPVIDTPQTITVIPEEVIQLQGLTDLRDVLRNDPSVSLHADEDSAQGTNVYIRGFSARFDTYLDGQLDLGNYYRDPFYLEEVDVLTGPSSVLFGRGSTGGAIEQVGKRPRPDPFTIGTLAFGTDGLKRLTTDANLPLGEGIALRLNGMLHQSGVAGRDVVGTERAGFAPSLAIGMGGATELLIGFLHQSQWDTPDYGVPWIDIGPGVNVSHPAPVPWSNFYGFKSDYSRVSADIATAVIHQEIDDSVSLRDQFRYAAYERNYRATDPTIGPVIQPTTPLATVAITRTERGGFSQESLLDDQIDLTGTVETFGIEHNFVVGGEFGRQTSDPTVLRFLGVPGTNLVSPDENQGFAGTATPRSTIHFVADTQALYATDTLRLDDQWNLNAAARLDRFVADYRIQIPPVVTYHHTDLRPSWRGALVYKPMDAISLYTIYGTSFDPSAEGLSLSASTANLSPERSHTIEAGAKWDPTAHLLLSAALFRTVMVNLREPSPVDPSITILAGTARSEGAEIEIQGRITDQWLVLGGYTYLNTSILSSPSGDRGSRLQNAPRHSVRMFSTYDLTDALTAGGGIDYSSSRVPGTVLDPNGFLQQVPGYWTASALIRCKIASGVSLQLNIDNLANTRFYDNLDDNHVNVGAGRSARLTLAVEE